jgi:hypothetical protein
MSPYGDIIIVARQLKALAIDITGFLTGTIAKAKAAHDYLFTNMRHEKSGSGRGRGDAV